MKKIYSLLFFFIFISGFCQNSIYKNLKPIEVVASIFKDYISYNESVDSEENKQAMKNALETIQKEKKLTRPTLLLNVWMYYDPTDFPMKPLIESILSKHKKVALIAIEERIKHKKKWETIDMAPLSDLAYLKKSLLSK
jgi:uncharacterized membrane protein YgaE (UPF0421/DUF939 family)